MKTLVRSLGRQETNGELGFLVDWYNGNFDIYFPGFYKLPMWDL